MKRECNRIKKNRLIVQWRDQKSVTSKGHLQKTQNNKPKLKKVESRKMKKLIAAVI